MNMENKKLSLKSSGLVAIIGTIGLFVTTLCVIDCIRNFNWPSLIIYDMIVACFTIVCLYIFKEGVTSKWTFRWLILLFSLIILLTGVVFNDPNLSPVANIINMVAALVSFGSLVMLDSSWQNVTSGTICCNVNLIAQTVSALIITVQTASGVLKTANPGIRIAQAWVIPIIAACIGTCYIFRMKQKAQEKRQ